MAKQKLTRNMMLEYIWRTNPGGMQAVYLKEWADKKVAEKASVQREAVEDWLANYSSPLFDKYGREDLPSIVKELGLDTSQYGSIEGVEEELPEEDKRDPFQEAKTLIEKFRATHEGRGPNRDEWATLMADNFGISVDKARELYDKGYRQYQATGEWGSEAQFKQWLDEVSEKDTLGREEFKWRQGESDKDRAEREKRAQEQKQLDYFREMSQLKGPKDWVAYQRMKSQIPPEAVGGELAAMFGGPGFGAVAPVETWQDTWDQMRGALPPAQQPAAKPASEGGTNPSTPPSTDGGAAASATPPVNIGSLVGTPPAASTTPPASDGGANMASTETRKNQNAQQQQQGTESAAVNLRQQGYGQQPPAVNIGPAVSAQGSQQQQPAVNLRQQGYGQPAQAQQQAYYQQPQTMQYQALQPNWWQGLRQHFAGSPGQNDPNFALWQRQNPLNPTAIGAYEYNNMDPSMRQMITGNWAEAYGNEGAEDMWTRVRRALPQGQAAGVQRWG